MAGVFEQFVAFGTDIVGLERLMRLLQSLFTILTCYPGLIPLLLPAQTAHVHRRSGLAMLQLSGHLNLTRRALRLFWCLGSFRSSFSAWAGLPSESEKGLETWLSITADSFFGLFGLVESVTLPDLLQVRHFSVLGYAEAVKLDGQAQGLWLAGLVCASLGSGIRLSREVFARTARSPAVGEAVVVSDADGEETDDKTATTENAGRGAGDAGAGRQQRDQQPRRGREKEALDKEHSRRIGGLTRKLAAEVLDVAIPAWSTGLADIEPGTVAVATFLSTILTGYAVWERCGRAIDEKARLDLACK
ncbi:hypothetical protein E4U43_007641 [Claviceps pusilla]|uniref:AoPex11B-like protein n=1 Tax=Claviceps pusilla TaxID=123648 RepID=A0A9P7NEK4_9HYPO|nr:hypothetical protein E4U43_007641 [Claviceps pusilla]